jgi:predicted  nucleic acid-binding Zn-ribbon protein
MIMTGYNHVCEDCGHIWESWKEDEDCPRCGSDSTQSSPIRVHTILFKDDNDDPRDRKTQDELDFEDELNGTPDEYWKDPYDDELPDPK